MDEWIKLSPELSKHSEIFKITKYFKHITFCTSEQHNCILRCALQSVKPKPFSLTYCLHIAPHFSALFSEEMREEI